MVYVAKVRLSVNRWIWDVSVLMYLLHYSIAFGMWCEGFELLLPVMKEDLWRRREAPEHVALATHAGDPEEMRLLRAAAARE